MNLSSKAGRNMPVAIASSVFLLALILIPLFYFPFVFALVVAVFAGLGAYELCEVLTAKRGMRTNGYVLGFIGFCIALLAYFQPNGWYLLYSLVFIVIGCIATFSVSQSQRDVKLTAFALFYVPFLLGFTNILIAQPWGRATIVLALLLIVSNDTGGLFAGMTFGKHKLAPTISPGKTWEGSAGSLVLASIVGVIMVTQFSPLSWWWGILAAIVVVITATVGDLFESKLKRTLGVKDMSQMIPGHGGVMDRLDSVVFTMPIMMLLYLLVSHLGILS